jgi:multidrug efflux pump subunit AcrA (membrane-fusion protein)
VNRPTVRDLRKPPWLTAGAVVVLATGLVAVGDSPARGTSYAMVRRGNVTATAGAAGTVRSADTRELAFGTAGTVKKVEVSPGDRVRAGAVLARLDDAAAKEQVDVAQATLAAAEDAYGKAQQGICTNSGGGSGGGGQGTAPALQTSYAGRPKPTRTPTPSPTPTTTSPRPTPTPTATSPKPTPTTRPTHSPRPTGHPKPTAHPRPDGNPKSGGKPPAGGGKQGGGAGACKPNAVGQAAAGVTQAEVKVREAERTLTATTLTAPMSGTVLSVAGTPGSQVGGASKSGFITLGDLSDLQVQAMFSLGEVDRLKIGQQATIGLGMLAGRQYPGTVTRIDPAATTSGSRALFGVMISLDDRPPGLLTGMSATVQVVTAQAESTLYVPAGAVHPRPGGMATVLVRHGGRTTTRTVRLGVRGDRYVAITSGLSAGDHVVTSAGTGPDGFPDGSFPAA